MPKVTKDPSSITHEADQSTTAAIAEPPTPRLRWIVYPGPHPQARIGDLLLDRDKPVLVDAKAAEDLISRKKVEAAKAPSSKETS